MQITERDIEILQFINEFGFCEMPQLEKRFNLKTPRSYKIMQRLVKAGLIIHERILYNRPGVFYLSQRGAKQTDLPAIINISLASYKHQIMIIEVYFKLIQRYPEAQWISERKLKRDKFQDGIGKRGHIADGMLIFPDQKKVAIEIELSAKGKRRINEIFRSYGTQHVIKEAWYFCAKKIVADYTDLAGSKSFIKIHKLEELFI
jgi:DNA-binding Lrp family transcriptional regulator